MRPLLLVLFLLAAPAFADDELHSQEWFLNSFLDLRQDLAEAKAEGKRLAVVFEQRGCPYCREMHEVHLADPTIAGYIRDNFAVLQINLHGAREVTDLDGAVLPENGLARKWKVRFTPTVVFLGEAGEVARMPGLLESEKFAAMFQWVREERTATPFAHYLVERSRRR